MKQISLFPEIRPDININEGEKQCRLCYEYKTLDNYHKNGLTKDGLAGECYTCRRRRMLINTYGITLEQYYKISEQQDGKCAICGESDMVNWNGKNNSLYVDHCHHTGRVRGLLCGHCNTGIGNLKDDISILKKSIEYLDGDTDYRTI